MTYENGTINLSKKNKKGGIPMNKKLILASSLALILATAGIAMAASRGGQGID